MELVFARLVGGRSVRRRLFNVLRFRFPIAVVGGGDVSKRVVFLKRHWDLWATVFRVFGWKVVETRSMGLGEFEEMFGDRWYWFPGLVKATAEEYRGVPKALSDPSCRVTRFHKLLASADLFALAIRGSWEEALRRELGKVLEWMVWRGVVPVDYSLSHVIVARRLYRGGWWLSTLGYDPLRVLRELEARPAKVVLSRERIDRLEFEERNVGWGLKVVER